MLYCFDAKVVFDDGDGVPEPIRADLSKRTFTDDPARRGGGGLGLAITNEVVRRAGWTIDFGAAEAGGLKVVICGPVARL